MIESIVTVHIDRPELPRTVSLISPLAQDVLGIPPVFCDWEDRFGGATFRRVPAKPKVRDLWADAKRFQKSGSIS